MDKIIELICEEARRRPGDLLIPKLYQVMFETTQRIGELILKLVEEEKEVDPVYHLKREGDDDSKIE